MTDSIWSSSDQSTCNLVLDRRLEADPDSTYLDVCGTSFSAAEVDGIANRIANTYLALGVQSGERVATLIENSPEAMLAWWGAIRCNAVAVPINTAYKGDYLVHQLADSGARVLVVEESLAERVVQVADRVPGLEHIVVIGDPSAVGGVEATTMTWEDLQRSEPSRPDIASRPSDLATFVYTGGTTGPSKGCMLSHNYHVALTQQIGEMWGRTAEDVVWTPLPLFHFNALVTAVLGPLVFGGRAAIYRRFSVSNFWPEMNRVGATVTSTLGTMA